MRRYLDCLIVRQEYRLHLFEDLCRQVKNLSHLGSQVTGSRPETLETQGPATSDFERLYKHFPRRPNLAVLLWQSDEGGKYFVGKKIEYLRQLGMDGFVREVKDQAHKEEVLAICAELANRSDVDAILLQQPSDLRPPGYDESLEYIGKLAKDVDGTDSASYYYRDWLKNRVNSASSEYYCSKSGMLSIPALIMLDLLSRTGLHHIALDLSKQVVVLGSDQVTYLPALKFFLSARVESTEITNSVVHDASLLQKYNLAWYGKSQEIISQVSLLSNASLAVSCLNEPERINVSDLPNLRCAFDFGYGYLPGTKQVRGDIAKFTPDDSDQVHASTAWVSPGIGGVGALISSALARNLYVNWKRNMKLS